MILPLVLTGKDSADIQAQILRALRDLNLTRGNIIALTAYAYHESYGTMHVVILLYDTIPTARTFAHEYEGSDAGAV